MKTKNEEMKKKKDGGVQYYSNAKEVADKVMLKTGELPVKLFESRNSPLTDLFETKDIRSLYHLCLAMFIGLFLTTAANDILRNGRAKFGLKLIMKGFGNIHITVLIWFGMFFGILLVYYGFKLWSFVRSELLLNKFNRKLWDWSWIGLLILYYPCFMVATTVAVTQYKQPIAASFALLSEMVRFMMKYHAFVRSNVPNVLKYKVHTDKDDAILCPELSKFMYFLFAPTLVYRDKYPRSSGPIQWSYIATAFIEVVAIIFLLSFIFERSFLSDLENYGILPYTWQDITLIVLNNALQGLFIIVLGFYCLLHAWSNAFAEMLRFSDRMFYKDWWTSANYERYYRTWNVVVHDWLYTYIYKDFYEIVMPKNKIAAKTMVFFVSAFFHDYIMGVSLGFYLPVFLINLFGAGLVMNYVRIKQDYIGNVILWYTMALGMSMHVVAFTLEYISRVNCPIEHADIQSYFIPRMFSCNKY